MAEMHVFISSTCYDLSLLRTQSRLFIKNWGYEHIMSDYEDVLYDPRIHTHTSCVDEVRNCDMLILIVGARFGGKATPEALNKVNFESFNRFLIISLDVLICRYSPLLRAFPALFISEEPHKSFYYPSCFHSQK